LLRLALPTAGYLAGQVGELGAPAGQLPGQLSGVRARCGAGQPPDGQAGFFQGVVKAGDHQPGVVAGQRPGCEPGAQLDHQLAGGHQERGHQPVRRSRPCPGGQLAGDGRQQHIGLGQDRAQRSRSGRRQLAVCRAAAREQRGLAGLQVQRPGHCPDTAIPHVRQQGVQVAVIRPAPAVPPPEHPAFPAHRAFLPDPSRLRRFFLA
jgi:hypothetical protein